MPAGPLLIDAHGGSEASSLHLMTDLIFIGIIVLFFAASALYARLCEKM
jgi:hypothetical protein